MGWGRQPCCCPPDRSVSLLLGFPGERTRQTNHEWCFFFFAFVMIRCVLFFLFSFISSYINGSKNKKKHKKMGNALRSSVAALRAKHGESERAEQRRLEERRAEEK